MEHDSKTLVLGHKGLVGSALCRQLAAQGYKNVLTWEHRGDWAVDLLDKTAVEWAFSVYRPQFVFMAAARVGGIRAHVNNHVGMLVDNINMQQNVMLAAQQYDVEKLLFLGSSCMYPETAPVPTPEHALMEGHLQAANEGYALAKICGVKLGQYLGREKGFNVLSAIPCNLFGPHDNFNVENSHVIPGMIARMHAAKEKGEDSFRVWGSPDASREFLFSDDLADALIHLMRFYESDAPINAGSGFTLDMKTLAQVIAHVVQYSGEIVFSGADVGTTHKRMDNSRLRASWQPKTEFYTALQLTYQSFLRVEGRR